MLNSITEYLPRIFTFYFLFVTVLSGAICYFFGERKLKKQFPKESKIAKYGGLVYVIGGPLAFIAAKIFFK